MNPFDQLGGGIAGCIGYGQQVWFDNRLMELYRQQAYGQWQQYQPLCVHPNCPICNKQREEREKMLKEQAEKEQHKKELYQERCKEYMNKHRVITPKKGSS